jgi:lipopolysaccharide biosynthesis glycosyltransferase
MGGKVGQQEELTVFIGWDGREKVAYEVLKHSIEKHTTAKVRIIPLYHKELRRQGFFCRPWQIEAKTGNYRDLIDGKPFSTEFSHTRFLIPELMGYKGWALFMDCDMIFNRCDIRDIFALKKDRYAAMCVKHKQNIQEKEKMDGSPQTTYFRKNWSSFVLINCGHESNRKLTKNVVNTADGSWLHQFSWLKEEEIGSLPDEYNWIEGTSRSNQHPKVIHYTLGGPWFAGYQDVAFTEDWWRYYESFHDDLPDPSDKILNVNYKELA